MKYLLTFFCLLAAFSSCSNDDAGDYTPPGKEITVLVYMAAENDLSSNAGSDIRQMIEGSKLLNANSHLIVFVDKANEKPYIAEIANGKETKLKEFEEEIVSSDPREMSDIIAWTTANYPAEEYGLVLWGHASGWILEDSIATTTPSRARTSIRKAFGMDANNNDKKWMNVPSMAHYIEETGIKFKYIFADACCFQCIENVYELRNATDWLIGSPAEIPGNGAPYHKILPHLFSESPDFYKGIIDEYEKYYYPSYSVPLSAARTSEAASLAHTASQLWNNMPMDNISAEGCIYYIGGCSVTGKGFDGNHICYDAYDIVWANTDEVTLEVWGEALDRMVAYSCFNTNKTWLSVGMHVSFSDFTLSPDRMKLISMFVPLKTYENGAAKYNEMIKSMAWYYASGLCNYMN